MGLKGGPQKRRLQYGFHTPEIAFDLRFKICYDRLLICEVVPNNMIAMFTLYYKTMEL